MDVLLIQYLDKMLEFEEAGYVVEALKLADKIMETFLEDRVDILFEKAKMEFRNGFDKEALLDFIKVYEFSEDREVYELILEAYYNANKDVLSKTFHNNIRCMEEYPHYRNQYQENMLDVVPIWQDEEILVYANIDVRQFRIYERQIKELNNLEKNQIAMMVNELWLNDIWMCENNCRIDPPFMDMNLPMYLVFDRDYWILFAQLYDIEPLLRKNRIVFLIGKQSVVDYLHEDMILFPYRYFYNGFQNEYEPILLQVWEACNQEKKKNTDDVMHYYETNANEIIAAIKTQRPKILFMTSRFTTILQYHTRDCMQAANRLNCETRLLIESDGIHRVTDKYKIKVIAEFKPDIIFNIDHFRFEHPIVPKQVVWITWVQDILEDIMSKETPMKLTDRDFVMNHFTTWKKFRTIGYDDKCLIEAPVPANSHVYKTYPLSDAESENYSCDICFVCHASDVDVHINEVVQRFPEDFQEALCAVYKGYQRYVYETGELFYSEEVFEEYIKGALSYHYNLTLRLEVLKYLAEDMCMWFNQRVFRQALVDWILDAGFTNIKLWGNGWMIDDKYKKYAMGPAENGETLSKIYQASKIVIGNNIMTTSAARAWETMLSGGFYMSNYIPEEEDVTDIRKIIEVDKDVVMFFNREDLIEKLHYYLEHEEERKEMIRRGQKAALENMTFDILMKKVIEEVAERLEENENGR